MRTHTAALILAAASAAAGDGPAVTGGASGLPPLPRPVTSFGATRLGDTVYAYGGHTGSAHSYSKAEQADELWALDLADPAAGWRTVAEGPNLQGNALVAAGGRVVLLGGFSALNAAGEGHDLHSQAAVRAFNPATGDWSDLPALPEPRSSFDAAADGDVMTVVGGWSMAGEADAVWHRTAYSIDLSAGEPRWAALPTPPTTRRALAATYHDGRLYVLGGMTEDSGPTTAVTVYDPKAGAWSQGPPLPGDAMNGFGCAAFSRGGRLYASTYDGRVQRLAEDGSTWDAVGRLPKARFFHRFVPGRDGEVLVLGGGDMSVGKYPDVDVLRFAN